MQAGIQYIDGLSVKSAVESGLEYIELYMDEADKLERIEALGGRICGICVPLRAMLTGDKHEVLAENARLILRDAVTYITDNLCSYIVLDTEGVNNTAVLEQLISESREFLISSDISIYIENGYKYENGRYYHNAYSDGRSLVELIDRLCVLCPAVNWKICFNVGHTNLLGINLKDMVRVCGKHIGLVHINDNDGLGDWHQMPYTFTTGRGTLSTDWHRFIGALFREKYDGYIIFDNKGTFARTPEKLHKVMLELMNACVGEWRENCFNTGKYLGQKGKKLILFGAGRMAETYMDFWGDKYRPEFVVDNNSKKWGQSFMGVPVKSPQEILNIPPEERNVWICNLNYDIIGAQLEGMGIEYRCYRDLYFV